MRALGLQPELGPEQEPGPVREQPPAQEREQGLLRAGLPELGPVPNSPGRAMGSEPAQERAQDNLELAQVPGRQAQVPGRQAQARDKRVLVLALDSCLAAAKATRGAFAPWRRPARQELQPRTGRRSNGFACVELLEARRTVC